MFINYVNTISNTNIVILVNKYFNIDGNSRFTIFLYINLFASVNILTNSKKYIAFSYLRIVHQKNRCINIEHKYIHIYLSTV